MTPTDFSTIRTLIVVFAVVFLVYRLSKRLRPGGNGAAQPDFEEIVHFGASLIDDGYEYFPDWSTSMIREFDDSVRLKLKHYYELSKSVAIHPRDKWPAIIQEQRTASRADRLEK